MLICHVYNIDHLLFPMCVLMNSEEVFTAGWRKVPGWDLAASG